MAIIAIDHVQLVMPVDGEAMAVEFYEGLPGIANVPKPARLAVRGGCWFEDGALKLHLGVEADFLRPARKAHPALVVDDPFGNRLELLAAVPRRAVGGSVVEP